MGASARDTLARAFLGTYLVIGMLKVIVMDLAVVDAQSNGPANPALVAQRGPDERLWKSRYTFTFILITSKSDIIKRNKANTLLLGYPNDCRDPMLRQSSKLCQTSMLLLTYQSKCMEEMENHTEQQVATPMVYCRICSRIRD